jgi:hypothetical protein
MLHSDRYLEQVIKLVSNNPGGGMIWEGKIVSAALLELSEISESGRAVRDQ